VPYVDSAFNQASFPLKAFEYLASGLPVVGTPLPALQWLAEGAPGGDQLRLAPTPAEFGRAAADLATLARNGSELRARCRALAGDHDWRLRSREVRSLLAASPERPGAPVREGER
jgi:teichuronic acid biosynthesis glycosyltransferase TuaH